MSEPIDRLRNSIRDLHEQLEDEYRSRREALADRLRNGRMIFEAETKRLHRGQREGLLRFLSHAEIKTIVTAPVIYSLVIPFALLHFWVWLYQAICFPAYGIKKVPMSDFIAIDRHHLRYLNALEKLNCAYCGYCNGVVAWTREVASRTEAHWCPIKHASRVEGAHGHYASFADYGDGEGYRGKVDEKRRRRS